MDHLLSVRNLSKAYNGKPAVDNISFDVRRHEIMGFLGPNGAGKTTAIRMILGILRPNGGEVSFFWNGEASALNKQMVGYLPEERGLYDNAKVLDSLIYLAALKGVDGRTARARAIEWLELLKLSDYANHKLEKLSKGMQQKVQFIATILHKPELVVLDEPFSGLDPINQDLFKEMILKLREEGITVLLSAHQMNVVQELCDRIFLINNGKAVLYGTLEEIRDQHKINQVVIEFTGEDNLERYLTGLRDASDVKVAGNRASLRLHTDMDVNQFIQEAGRHCTLKGIKVEKPQLHEIFIETVGGRSK